MAIREDEDVARAMGVRVVHCKAAAFVISAALAGVPDAVLWDRPDVVSLRASDTRRVLFDVPEPVLEAGGSRFAWRGIEVALAVPGAHNARNAAAALEACALAGADVAVAARALSQIASL